MKPKKHAHTPIDKLSNRPKGFPFGTMSQSEIDRGVKKLNELAARGTRRKSR
jgi:hypothetical protein